MRGKGEGNIRKRPDGRWEARYTAGRDPKTGKQKRRSVYGKTQNEVRDKLNQVQNDIINGVYVEPSKLTTEDWFDIWLKEYTGGIKERTRKEYKGQIEYRIKPYFGKLKLSSLKAHQIQEFYNDCLHGTKNRKAISPKTVKNIHGIVHEALSQAVELGYLKVNPSSACKLPRVEKAEIKPLDETQISAFLKEISGHPYELLYAVSLFLGVRQGEILGLSWSSINFQDGTIRIQRQLQRIDGVYKSLPLKNDKERLITPAPYVMRLLKEQKRKQSIWKLRAGPAWDNSLDLVFTNEIGGNLARETVYKHYKRIVKRLGLEETRFHDLRHSYAVASLQAGDDIKTVQENLGHHTAAFTLDTYGYVTERMKRDSADRMERFIISVKEPL